MERDYARLRNAETRYRLLFQESAEPTLVVDASTRKVTEANPAAALLFGDQTGRVIGRPLLDVFDAESRGPVHSMLDGVRAAGRADDAQAVLTAGGGATRVSASVFRQDGTLLFLVRLSRLPSDAPTSVLPKMTWKLLKLIENAPDGFVVTDADGLILSANAAFVEMAELSSDQQARNETLDRWLGRPSIDLGVLIANLRQHGQVRLYASTVRGSFGTVSEVEISAVSVMNSERQCLGFAIRNVGRRLRPEGRPGTRSLPPSVQHLTELVGRVSLKDLVREATDVIERLSIDAALELTGGNRASAAEMLGVSRQSLYVKLRRYGIIDSAESEEDAE
jgi:transcriptional regulator PpsR